jgi:RNA polymerase sigma-70 factor (ECF subfamily)
MIDMVTQTYKPGNPEDFERLYRTTYSKLINVTRMILKDHEAAEDCVHDAYVQAFRKWAEWKPTAPAEAWLMRITKNAAISHIRRRSIRTADEFIKRVGAPRAESEDPAAFIDHEDLWVALSKLSEVQREAMILRYVHGYTNRAIAARTGIPERTIASRIGVARKHLQAQLGSTYAKTSEEEAPFLRTLQAA